MFAIGPQKHDEDNGGTTTQICQWSNQLGLEVQWTTINLWRPMTITPKQQGTMWVPKSPRSVPLITYATAIDRKKIIFTKSMGFELDSDGSNQLKLKNNILADILYRLCRIVWYGMHIDS